jgi:hypothetical protein
LSRNGSGGGRVDPQLASTGCFQPLPISLASSEVAPGDSEVIPESSQVVSESTELVSQATAVVPGASQVVPIITEVVSEVTSPDDWRPTSDDMSAAIAGSSANNMRRHGGLEFDALGTAYARPSAGNPDEVESTD